MAQGQISNYTKNTAKVYCARCSQFTRDTDGHSRSRETGEFFMGRCGCGHSDVPSGKLFANKPRVCDTYNENETTQNNPKQPRQ